MHEGTPDTECPHAFGVTSASDRRARWESEDFRRAATSRWGLRSAGAIHLAVALRVGADFCSVKEGDGDRWSRHGGVRGARHFTFWREQEWREVLAAAGWSVERLDLHPGSKLGENWLHVVAVRSD